MSNWTETSAGKTSSQVNTQNDMGVLTYTVTLGAAKGNRYSPEFHVPPGVPFTIISNTAGTNLSGSAADQLYVGYTSGGTFYQKLAHLRDANYVNKTNAGVANGSVDNTSQVRYVDPSFIGQYPYYKVRILQSAVESSAKTVGLAIIIGDNPKAPYSTQ